MKNNKDIRKTFITNNIFKLALFILLGLFAGIMCERSAKDDKINYLLISLCFFTAIGLLTFLISFIKYNKKNKKRE